VRRGLACAALTLVAILAGCTTLSLPASAQVPEPACVWEWGGEPEPTPAPCPTPSDVAIANEGDFATRVLEVGIIVVFFSAVLTVVSFARRR